MLFDGCGGEHDAIIAAVGREGVAVEVGPWREVAREASLTVHLAQGVSSGERMDYTLQKAVELGVAGIEPILTARSIVRLEPERAEKRRAHWERVCVSACEQCGRDRVPPVQPLRDLGDWFASLPTRAETFALRLLLSPDATSSLRDLPRPAGPILLLAGPEGGLTPAGTRRRVEAWLPRRAPGTPHPAHRDGGTGRRSGDARALGRFLAPRFPQPADSTNIRNRRPGADQ